MHFKLQLLSKFEVKENFPKWLLSCSYNSQKSEIKKHLGAVGKNLDSYSLKYENFILFEDFNVEPTEDAKEEFMKVYNLKILVKGPTCFKNPDKPSCIDLILTNKSKKFSDIPDYWDWYIWFSQNGNDSLKSLF